MIFMIERGSEREDDVVLAEEIAHAIDFRMTQNAHLRRYLGVELALPQEELITHDTDDYEPGSGLDECLGIVSYSQSEWRPDKGSRQSVSNTKIPREQLVGWIQKRIERNKDLVETSADNIAELYAEVKEIADGFTSEEIEAYTGNDSDYYVGLHLKGKLAILKRAEENRRLISVMFSILTQGDYETLADVPLSGVTELLGHVDDATYQRRKRLGTVGY